MRRLLAVVAAACVLLACAGAGAAEAKVPRIPAGWAGVAADGPLLEHPGRHRGEWRRMRANRVGFVRAAFVWRAVQPTDGPIDLHPTDAIVLAAAKQGLSVLPEVHGTPSWAAVDPENEGSRPKDPARYAAVLRAMVRRYGPDGTLWAKHRGIKPRPIRRWQVWNEPNTTAYWAEQPFAPAYVELLRAARAAVREEDPGAQLLLAGLPNRSWEDLHSIYEAGGRGLFDAVALHPYTGQVYDVIRVVRFVRKEMRGNGDGGLPTYLTEVSWPASAKFNGVRPGGFEVTDEQQADKLRQALRALAAERRSLHIAGVVWYTWLSAERKARPSWSGFSGLRRLRHGKVVTVPALAAFRQTVGALRRR